MAAQRHTPNPNSHIIVVDGVGGLTDDVKQAVGRAGPPVEQHRSFASVPALDESISVVVVSCDAVDCSDLASLMRARHATPHSFVVASARPTRELADLFEGGCLHHVVALRDGHVDVEDLSVTLEKLLSSDFFGIHHYFDTVTDHKEWRLTRSADRTSIIAELEHRARRLFTKPSWLERFTTAADELIGNALYHGPVDADGNPRFPTRGRGEHVMLDDAEEVVVTFCSDAKRVGIAASDPFGSLPAERITHYMGKCLRQGPDQLDTKAGGAGLGLYTVHRTTSQFVLNLAPGKRTEAIALLEHHDGAGARSRARSFHVFVAGT